MKSERFEYPTWQKVMRVTMMLVFVLVAGIGAIVLPIVSFALQGFEHPIMERLEAPDPASLIAGLAIGAFILTVGYLVFGLAHPNIEVCGESFRLYTPMYKSNWLFWDDIREVRELAASVKWSRQIGISVEGISPLYNIVGVTQSFGDQRTFVVHQSLHNFKGFLALLHEKRPDLFDMEGWT